MCWKTADLKDDIVYGKDDFYKSRLYYIEDAENKDDIVTYADKYSIVYYISIWWYHENMMRGDG